MKDPFDDIGREIPEDAIVTEWGAVLPSVEDAFAALAAAQSEVNEPTLLRPSLLSRVMTKVMFNPQTGCWDWQGTSDHNGYGQIYDEVTKQMVGVHRYVFQRMVGPLDPGEEPDHRCRRRQCIWWDHMERKTKPENIRQAHYDRLHSHQPYLWQPQPSQEK